MGTETRAQALWGAAGSNTPQIGLVGNSASPSGMRETATGPPRVPSDEDGFSPVQGAGGISGGQVWCQPPR
jgi:hypothetical protein